MSGGDPMTDSEAIARQFIAALPHSHALGMRLEAGGGHLDAL
jgi:hypothetical protein